MPSKQLLGLAIDYVFAIACVVNAFDATFLSCTLRSDIMVSFDRLKTQESTFSSSFVGDGSCALGILQPLGDKQLATQHCAFVMIKEK